MENQKSKIKNQKLSLLFLIVFLGSLLLPTVSLARLVPCGYDINADGVYDPATERCTLCHLFKMIVDIASWVITYLVIPVGTLMLIIGGFMFFFAGTDPGMLSQAKKILTSTVIGLVVIFSAWLIVGTFLNALGVVHIDHIMTPWNVNALCPLPR